MADKSTRLMMAALTRAAAEPAGLPLFAAKSAPGLFPPTASARPLAQRCKEDGYLHVVGNEGKPAREVCRLTDKGLSWLLNHASPRQVLEDFVRVLEERQRQATDLVATARHMTASLDALKSAVVQLRPLVERHHDHQQVHHVRGETKAGPAAVNELNTRIVAQLEQWHATAPGDCPLPELYRRVHEAQPHLSIGGFHDALRALYDRHRLYLHPWTGPLYDLPEPPFALLIGHEIAYYASLRNQELPTRSADRSRGISP